MTDPITAYARRATSDMLEAAIALRKADQATYQWFLGPMFAPGRYVIKKTPGVEFCGIIRSIDEDDDGVRMIVKSIAPGARHILHIDRPDQFRLMTDAEIAKIERMREIWEEPQ